MCCKCESHSEDTVEVTAGAESWPTMTPEDLLAQWQQKLAPHPAPLPPEPCESRSARELCELCRIRLKSTATRLLDAEATPQQFYGQLLRNDCLADARRVLAHAMPKRRALWWGCLVATDVDAHKATPEIARVLPAVMRFVVDPTEENRRICEDVGKQVPANSLAGSLAMAAFFSGGSISLPQLPLVHPRPFVTGRLVGVAVYLASVIRSAADYKNHLRDYLHIGEQVARGQSLWDVSETTDHEQTARCDATPAGQALPEPHYSTADVVAPDADRVAVGTYESMASPLNSGESSYAPKRD